MEDMRRNKDDTVLMRHRREKHGGDEIEVEMKIVASYLHDPLARQCAESVWIKKIDPDKRINNKTEFHQPGDIEVRHEKNINENLKKKKEAAEERRKTCDVGRKDIVCEEMLETNESLQTKISDFFGKRVGSELERVVEVEELMIEEEIDQVETIEEEEEFCSQANNNQLLQCDTCDYETRSVTMLTRHVETIHKRDDTTVTRHGPHTCD